MGLHCTHRSMQRVTGNRPSHRSILYKFLRDTVLKQFKLGCAAFFRVRSAGVGFGLQLRFQLRTLPVWMLDFRMVDFDLTKFS